MNVQLTPKAGKTKPRRTVRDNWWPSDNLPLLLAGTILAWLMLGSAARAADVQVLPRQAIPAPSAAPTARSHHDPWVPPGSVPFIIDQDGNVVIPTANPTPPPVPTTQAALELPPVVPEFNGC